MASTRNYIDFTLPPGRLVQGSLTVAQDKDATGNPLIVKTGPNVGQPRVNYYFAVAVPKTPGVHWATEDWGAPIWAEGHAAFPGGQTQRADFAWKITDGDSVEPDQNMKRPCDREGFAGHWVVRFSGGKAPQVYSLLPGQASPVIVPDPAGAVGLGDFVQVRGSVCGNGEITKPGVYLNHSMVCLRAYGPRISTGPDVASAGFGGGALPPGASFTPPAAAPGQLPPPPAAPGAGAPMPAAQSYAPPPVAAPTIPTTAAPTPSPAHVGLPPMAPPPPAPAPAPGPTMLPAANGVPYDAYRASGWTDEQLRASGLMA